MPEKACENTKNSPCTDLAGMDVVLHAMAAAEWEVRNSASLAFAALLHRMLGFSNPVKVRSACRDWMQCRASSDVALYACQWV